MRRRLLAALSAAAAVSVSFVSLATSADAAPSAAGVFHRNDHVCSTPAPGFASCSAIRHSTVDANGNPVNDNGTKPNATHAGYATDDLRAAYALGGASGAGKTVAIVDAYDDPYAESDLQTYRNAYGLPACTTANGCFRKVNQTGGKSYPRANGGWSQEISLDLDVVSATCPDCNILLVEASSASFANLSAAVNYAASQKPAAISNSYGGSDSSAYAGSYDHPGIAVTASTGDSGYGVQSPASLPGVVAVGGTSLTKVSTGVYTEQAWSGAGSGCSTLNDTTWQDKKATACPKKANADVSAVADPNTGVTVYDSYAYQGYKGWMVFGGTSASSPLIASVFAMGSGVPAGTEAGSLIWAQAGNAAALNDVQSGSNGTCSTPVWCTSGTGWDGPTGLGTPNGTGAF